MLNSILRMLQQEDPTVMAYNLMNEPRCNCAPTVVDSSTGYAAEDPNTDCANIKPCFTAVQARTAHDPIPQQSLP